MDEPPVVIASYSGVLGGAERVLLDCATRMRRPVVVACPEGPLAAALAAASVRRAPLRPRGLRRGARHVVGVFGMASELQRVIRAHRPAALVAWGARAVMASSIVFRGPPRLAVHHDLHRSPAVLGAVRATTRRADAVAAASEAIAGQFEGPVTVLHPGVDLDAFTPRPLPPGPPHALVLGALVAWKRPELALEIAARVPDLRLTIAGATLPGDDGALEAELRRRAGERVTIAGALDDVQSALAAAHVLLHCADAEPYGLVLVEALAAGRPVVAPRAGGPLEIVAGGAGRLYPPGDADAAARAVQEVLADPDAGAAARRRAEAGFDVWASVRRFEDAIDTAILSRAGRRPPADVTVSG